MGTCTQSSAFTTFCSNPIHNCGSSSSTLRPPAAYQYCTALQISNNSDVKNVVCFATSAMCQTVTTCPDNHVGNVTVSLSPLGVGTTSVIYTQKCCNKATCVTLPYSDVAGEDYQRNTPQSCNANNGTCVPSQPSWRCKPGFYNSLGFGPTARVPDCVSCATATSVPQATSAAGSKDITECYVPANITQNSTKGTYKYTSSCYWTN